MGLFKGHEQKLQCSFCGKPSDAVGKLIAGPSVLICNECVNVCLEILVNDAVVNGAAVQQALPCLAGVETELRDSQYFRQLAATPKHH